MLTSIDFLSKEFTLEKLISDFEADESSVEDEEVLETDTMVVTTHTSEEANSILFYVYSDEYFYPHHEISFPTMFFDCRVIKNDFVAAAALSNDILIFDPKIKFVDEPSSVLSGHDSIVTCLDYQNNLISASEDRTIIFWEDDRIKERIDCKEEINKFCYQEGLIAHFSNTKCVLRSKNSVINEIVTSDLEDIKFKNDHLILCNSEGELIFYDVRNFSKEVFKISDESINSFDVFNDLLVVGSDDKKIRLVDFNEKKVKKVFKVSDSVSKVKVYGDICFYGGEKMDLKTKKLN